MGPKVLVKKENILTSNLATSRPLDEPVDFPETKVYTRNAVLYRQINSSAEGGCLRLPITAREMKALDLPPGGVVLRI